ncbi:MAG: GxxExxY protein [Candidatus Latescibacterota bacterium]|jgi:GxxExxY protein
MVNENDLTGIIVDCCIKIHSTLGPGLFESVYEEALSYELHKRNIPIERQIEIPVMYESVRMNVGFRADIIVDKRVIVELKSVDTLLPVHKKQLLTYLKLTKLKIGLLLNFNVNLMKEGIVRAVNNL